MTKHLKYAAKFQILKIFFLCIQGIIIYILIFRTLNSMIYKHTAYSIFLKRHGLKVHIILSCLVYSSLIKK